MFCDEAEVKFISGKGGDGLVSWRREKYIPRGGPDGGNGGKGGDLVLVVDRNLNTLSNFRSKKVFEAEGGQNGMCQKKNGKGGESLLVKVPIGTQVFENDELLADLSAYDSEFVVVRGGKGGFGNAHFVSSVRQAPSFAELGEKAEQKKLRLELKLVADAAIIGFPSVGKSTLIASVSQCKPKIASYPFTTLIPNLGIAQAGEKRLVLVDVPGLIEGAHRGKGLGIQFLKHTERARVILHLLDISRPSVLEDFEKINYELEAFSKKLAQKKQVLAINKSDILTKEEGEKVRKKLEKKLKRNIFLISAVSGVGTKELLFEAEKINSQEKAKELSEKEETKEVVEFTPHLDNKGSFWVEKEGNAWRVFGKRILQIAAMSDFGNEEAVMRLRDIMKKMGIERELLRLGVNAKDKICFDDKILHY